MGKMEIPLNSEQAGELAIMFLTCAGVKFDLKKHESGEMVLLVTGTDK